VPLDLEYLEQAVADAEAAARSYAERSTGAAARFTAELEKSEEAILAQPEAWPVLRQGHGASW
jgi:hypothetical protein